MGNLLNLVTHEKKGDEIEMTDLVKENNRLKLSITKLQEYNDTLVVKNNEIKKKYHDIKNIFEESEIKNNELNKKYNQIYDILGLSKQS